MASLPKKTAIRLSDGIKRFQPILASAKSRDLNESDTVMIVTDILADIFGYDKYSEITSEQAIRGTYCDLAIKIDGQIKTIIEVKAVGLDLKEAFIKQAVDYAANAGIEWVALTNGEQWKVFKVTFGKPIGQELILEFNFSELNQKNPSHLQSLFILTKEGWTKSAISTHFARRQALNRFNIGALLQSDAVISLLRKELKRLSPDVKIEADEISTILTQEVLRREIVDDARAVTAKRQISRIAGKIKKVKTVEQPVNIEADAISMAVGSAD